MLQSQPSESDRKVFVGGLPSFSTERSLYSYFSQFGEIESVNIVMDKHTNRSKGYGFVLFKEAVSAYASVTNPYPFIDGKSCNCNIASLGAKPQGTQKKGGKRTNPNELDDLQNKRMKTERSKSKHSYIQQLQQELNIEITKDYVLSNIEQMKMTAPAPDVFKYLLEMMDVFEDSQEEYTKLYNELLEASKEYRKIQIQNDRMHQQQTDEQQLNAIYNGKEINYQNIENQVEMDQYKQADQQQNQNENETQNFQTEQKQSDELENQNEQKEETEEQTIEQKEETEEQVTQNDQQVEQQSGNSEVQNMENNNVIVQNEEANQSEALEEGENVEESNQQNEQNEIEKEEEDEDEGDEGSSYNEE